MDAIKTILSNPVTAVMALPALAGIVCLLLPKTLDKLRVLIAILAAAVTVYLGWQAFTGGLRVNDLLRVDTLSSFVLLAVTVFGLLIAVYSAGFMKGRDRQKEYYAYLLWTIGASCGAVLANDLILLLCFWGFLGLTLYLMIGIAGPGASAAAKKTFIIIGGSDCLLLLGVALIWMMTDSTRMDQKALVFNAENVYVAFLCIAAAAFAKAGAMPLHTWVPDCGEKAPVPVTAFLPASLDKLLGIYLLARAATGMFDMATGPAMGTLLMVAGAATVLLAVMMALVQHDLKRLLSYHAVSQVGYMVLGIGTGNPIGIAGGLFHMLNHAIYKSCLFLCAGSVEKKTGTTDLDKLGGLARVMPLTFGACFVAALAISGIPPLNGFASKWMVYQGIIESGKSGGTMWIIWLVAAMLGSALTLASFVKVLHAVFLCKRSPELEKKKIREVGFSMWAPAVLLALVCILFGVAVYSLPIKHFIGPAVAKFNPGSLLGIWYAGPATIMLVSAFVLGLIIYLITTARKPRECETYIGGEVLKTDVQVTAVDSYRTVQNMDLLRPVYDAAQAKMLDTYDVGQRVVFYFVKALRAAHTGILSTYLTWVLAGLMVLIFVLRKL